MFKLQHLDHVAITVRDLDASVAWYTKTLGLENHTQWEGEPQMLSAGESAVALFQVEGPGIEISEGYRDKHLVMQHFAFRVDRANFEAAQESFREQGIVARFADHGVCHSVYIQDPDGHRIEITTYEV